MRKRIIGVGLLCLLFFLNFSTFGLAANLQDPFEAYGLKKGNENIPFVMTDNPPEVFVLKPIEYRYGEIRKSLSVGQITLEKGEDYSFNISVDWRQGHTSTSVKSHITIKYRLSIIFNFVAKVLVNDHFIGTTAFFPLRTIVDTCRSSRSTCSRNPCCCRCNPR